PPTGATATTREAGAGASSPSAHGEVPPLVHTPRAFFSMPRSHISSALRQRRRFGPVRTLKSPTRCRSPDDAPVNVWWHSVQCSMRRPVQLAPQWQVVGIRTPRCSRARGGGRGWAGGRGAGPSRARRRHGPGRGGSGRCRGARGAACQVTAFSHLRVGYLVGVGDDSVSDPLNKLPGIEVLASRFVGQFGGRRYVMHAVVVDDPIDPRPDALLADLGGR